MLVSPEIFVWIGGALFAQLTLTTHLLIAILKTVSEIKTKQALQQQRLDYLDPIPERK